MKRIAAIIIGLTLMLPGSALANSSCNSSGSAYNGQDCQVASNIQSRTTTTATAAVNAGSLPFTGLDVVLLIAGGGTLLCAGLVVRRMSRNVHE
jgi:hypothetical protein